MFKIILQSILTFVLTGGIVVSYKMLKLLPEADMEKIDVSIGFLFAGLLITAVSAGFLLLSESLNKIIVSIDEGEDEDEGEGG